MKKRLLLLLVSFIGFYALVHLIRHLPELAHGRLSWQGENTPALSLTRIIADMVIACLFTLLPYLLLHRFYPERKFIPLTASIVVSLTGCFVLGYFWTVWTEAVPVRLRDYFPSAIFFYMVDGAFGAAFYFIRYAQYQELQQKEATIQSRQAELMLLQSQVNPHFLFNNLNNIYSLVYHQSEQALPAISGLSELLRYMLYDTTEMVPLKKETGYIEKYIALQQLRFEVPTNLAFVIRGSMDGIDIAPLLFIPFVENAFKHGNVSTGEKWLDITLTVNENYIGFYCRNKKTAKRTDPVGGIGIDNIKRRLMLLYPDKHTLGITDGPEEFTVKLELAYGK